MVSESPYINSFPSNKRRR